MTLRWRLLAAAGIVLGALGAAWLMTSSAPVGRALGLVAEDGEKVLNRPMREARGGTRVILLALDGVGDSELRTALVSGMMPNAAAALGVSGDIFASAYAVDDVLSVLPSTTLAAWTSLFTGEPPARTGVPGNEWFVREERRFYAPAPVTIEEADDALAVYTDGLLGGAIRVPTLYEHAGVRSYVSLSQVHRGADVLLLPDAGALGDLVAAAVRGVADADESVSQEVYRELDANAVDRLLETLRNRGVPDLLVVYFPGVDLFTHVAEHALADQQTYLRDGIDPAIGHLLDAYRGAGVLEDTWIIFVSDHGHTPVLPDDRHALGTDGADDPPAVLTGAGFRMRAFRRELDAEEEDFQATVAYQGAMAYVYLADRSGCPQPGERCDWLRPPRFDEDVLPVVRAFDAANRTGEHVPALRGTLDLILARQPRPPGEDALPFEVWDGRTLVPIGEFLRRHPRPELLDFEKRMRGLAAGPYGHRAGDVLLLARSGIERPIDDRYYFSSKYRSWHGSPTGQDSRIPLIVGRSGVPAQAIRERVRRAVGERPSQLDVLRLILALLHDA
jgi:hypothetical protein